MKTESDTGTGTGLVRPSHQLVKQFSRVY